MFTVELPVPRAKRNAFSFRPNSDVTCYPFPTASASTGTKVSSCLPKCFFGILKPDCVEAQSYPDEIYEKCFFGKRATCNQSRQVDSSQEKRQCDAPSPEEVLILSFEEAFFLCYALGRLVVKDGENMLNVEQLWQKLLKLTEATKEDMIPFPALYTAYHHFRSKGWIVKPGLKFGSHFVLYKDGPSYYHATYSVRVLWGEKCSAAPSWKLLAALNRTTVNAGKNLLLCYVLFPENFCDFSLPTCIKQFQVQEMLLNRWVAAAERSE